MTSSPGSTFEPLVRAVAEPEIAGRTPLQLFWQRFRKDRFAPWIVKVLGHLPSAQYPSELDLRFGTTTGPSWPFLFGVDSLGRDVFGWHRHRPFGADSRPADRPIERYRQAPVANDPRWNSTGGTT